MKKRTPFDYIKSINNKEFINDIVGFSSFIVNKVYSADAQFVFISNAINKKESHKLPPKCIYDFYYETIPKNRKWLKYPKSEKQLEHVKYIMEYYGCSEHNAKDYLELINKEELQDIIDYNKEKGE